jgi:hypothetical protein
MCRIQLLLAQRNIVQCQKAFALPCHFIVGRGIQQEGLWGHGFRVKEGGGMDSESRRRTCSDSIFSMSKFKFQTVLLCSLESTLFNFVRVWHFNFGRSRYIWQPVECSNNYLQSLTTVKQLPGTIDFALQGSAGCPCHAR